MYDEESKIEIYLTLETLLNSKYIFILTLVFQKNTFYDLLKCIVNFLLFGVRFPALSQAMIKAVDNNNNASVDFCEFAKMVRLNKKAMVDMHVESLKEEFKRFSKNGLLGFKEFKKFARHWGVKLSPKDFKILYNYADSDRSGALDCDEFIAIMMD